LLKDSNDVAIRRLVADQKRRLALALERERQGSESSLIVLTEVKEGAGITTLAFALALEFAQLGLRAVVVEANPVIPDPRYREPGRNDGLLDILIGSAELGDVIVPATGLLADRVPVGLPVQPLLFAYERLTNLFAELKQRYPVVLVDAPPVLLSADSEFLSGIADITLLAIPAMHLMPGELKRAARILEKVNPKAISFVVTQLEATWGGGYYTKMVAEYSKAVSLGDEVVRTHPLTEREHG
jgi:succinoglycan biosynthesis transport protein ExoP